MNPSTDMVGAAATFAALASFSSHEAVYLQHDPAPRRSSLIREKPHRTTNARGGGGAKDSAIMRTRPSTERRARTTTAAFAGTTHNGTSACSRCFKPLPCDWALIGFVKPGRYDTMSKKSAARLPQREKGGGR
jgi:hypothetical protein